MAVIIDDKVYSTKKPDIRDAERHISTLKRLLGETTNKLEKLEREGLSGFGDDSKKLYLAQVSRYKEEIERLNDGILRYEADKKASMEVSIGMSEEDFKRIKGKKRV